MKERQGQIDGGMRRDTRRTREETGEEREMFTRSPDERNCQKSSGKKKKNMITRNRIHTQIRGKDEKKGKKKDGDT